MINRVFVSVSSYLAGRLLGIHRGQAELQAMLAELSREHPPSVAAVQAAWLPAIRTVNLLRHLVEIELSLDCGATCIGKSRSRHFTSAFESTCGAWLTLDDDVELSIETLAWLLAAVDSDEPRLCMAPCLLREQGVANVEWSPIYSTRPIHHEKYPHGEARAAKRGGFGAVVMNRGALEAIANANGRDWRDDDGKQKFAVFRDHLEGDRWHGEDLSFFARLPASVQVEALSVGESLHAGYGLDFGEL